MAVRDFVANGGGDPVAGGADAALVAGWTEVAALAVEGKKAFVAAVGALEASEAGSEVAIAEEGFDGGGGYGVERSKMLAVSCLAVGRKSGPAVVNELPDGRGAGAAGLANGWHKMCS